MFGVIFLTTIRIKGRRSINVPSLLMILLILMKVFIVDVALHVYELYKANVNATYMMVIP